MEEVGVVDRIDARWLPRQQGAWAMVLAPLVVGLWITPLQILHGVFSVAWVAAYLASLDLQEWLRARGRRRRFVAPLGVYCAVAVGGGAVVLAARPALIRLAPVLAILLAISVVCIVRGAIRSVLNDLAAQASACLCPVMVAVIGAPASGSGGGWLGLDVGSGPGDGGAWLASTFLFSFFASATVCAKAMIGQRGEPGWNSVSVACYAAIAVGAWVVAIVLAIGLPDRALPACSLATSLLAYAAVIPRLWLRATPKQVGQGEVAATALLMVMVIVAV
jgi:hypothetical protein